MGIDQQTKDFIQTRLKNGELPSSIVDRLKGGGWTEHQAAAAVQSISGVQLAVATPGSIQSAYMQRPLSVFILFLLSFPALLLGLFLVGVGILSLLLGGIFSVLIGALLIYYFIINKRIKDGSLSALKVLTGLVIISLVINGWRVYDSAISIDLNSAIYESITSHGLIVILLAYIWIRHRAYFH